MSTHGYDYDGEEELPADPRPDQQEDDDDDDLLFDSLRANAARYAGYQWSEES
jgi:hypothetical protein